MSLLLFAVLSLVADAERPNVVLMLADDMGYGEIEALNPKRSAIPTPHLNRLAAEGMTFTDAHTSSSVCSPTRYNLLTGRYAWRTRLQKGVLTGGEEPLIAADRLTLGHLFQRQGYETAIIGKWHLDYTYVPPDDFDGRPTKKQKGFPRADVPVGTRIPDGPLTRGFDHFFGFHHARSMGSLVRDDRIVEAIPAVDVLPRLASEAVKYIGTRDRDDKPFLLYIPLSSPHTPIVPAENWKGKGEIGTYGDFVAQTDGVVGEVLDALDASGLSDDSIVFFSADNGTSKAADLDDLKSHGHHPSGPYRGSKADLWEGGHRVPLLVRWLGRVEENSQSDQLVCLGDLMATFAAFFEMDLPDDAAEDSISFLPALFGQPVPEPRTTLVHHSITGQFAIRDGDWKFLLAPGSGGWTAPKGPAAIAAGLPPHQLYNLVDDRGEQRNLIASHRVKADELADKLITIVSQGRSTPGRRQANDARIDIWKRKLWQRE